jgi:hypothetical protein
MKNDLNSDENFVFIVNSYQRNLSYIISDLYVHITGLKSPKAERIRLHSLYYDRKDRVIAETEIQHD